MNFTLLSLVIALVVWGQPCDKKGVALNREFDLRVGQEITVAGTDMKVRFDSVKEDSRCPEGVDCIWEGNAKIALTLKQKSETGSVELNTTVEPKRQTYKGYEITMSALRPHPKANTTIDKKDYVATLALSKK